MGFVTVVIEGPEALAGRELAQTHSEAVGGMFILAGKLLGFILGLQRLNAPVVRDRNGSTRTGGLEEIVQQIVEVLDPERIIVFGSYERGDAGPHSGVDIAVIANTSEPRGLRTQRLAEDWPHGTVPTDPNEAAHERHIVYARACLRDALGVET